LEWRAVWRRPACAEARLKQKPDYVPELDATRGIAALLVAGYHICGTPLTVNGATTNLIAAAHAGDGLIEHRLAALLWALFTGDGAVRYFFVLSGFVLAISLSREGPSDWTGFWRFGIRRIFRIYPAVIFAVLCFAALMHSAGLALNPDAAVYGLGSILRNMLLFDVTINGVTWTMQTELIATPLIFLCFALMASGRTAALIGLTLCLAALSFVDAWQALFSNNGISRTAPLYAFAVGVLAYASGGWIMERVGSQRCMLMLAAALIAFFLANPLLGAAPGIAALVQVMASAAAIVLLAFGRWDAPFRILTAPVARLIGRVSFSFYLLHPLTIAVVWPMGAAWTRAVDAGVPPTIVILGLWIATSAVTIALAILSHRYVELPANALGRRAASLWRTRQATTLARGEAT
jgi:peptidoglycan/LPS O-acetylase OafA/YrhL